MDVKTGKQLARALAQKGETAKALAVYRKILEHLEGSKGILRELPLYIKAGDLCFKQGDTKAALAMYDKAGQLYAEHGSGKSVIAVCGRILEVLPEGINTHLHYARLLIEGGHAGEARKVLVNYAMVFDFVKMQEALEMMEGRSDDDVMPVLEMVLEMAERSGEEAAEPEATSESSEMVEPGNQVEEAERESEVLDSLDPVDMEPDAAQPDIAQPGDYEEAKADAGEELEISKGAADMLDERPIARTSLITGNIASVVDEPGDQDDEAKSPADSDSAIVKSGGDWEAEESSITVREESPEEEPAATARAEIPVADVPALAAVQDPTISPNINLAPPDEPPKLVTMEESEARVGDAPVEELTVDRFSESHPKVDSSGNVDTVLPMKPTDPITSSPAPVRPSGSAQVAIPQPRPSTPQRRVSGSIRVPGSRGVGPRKIRGLTVVVLVIIAAVVGFALWKLVPFGGGSPAAAAADSPADAGAAVVQDVRSTPAPIQPTDSSTLAQAPSVDSIPDSTDIELEPPPADLPVGGPAERASVPLISVEGLVVETVTPLTTQGRTGYLVVQVLDSGERFTLAVFPITVGAAAEMTEGAVQITSNPDGTAEGIVRFGDYEVRARGAISAELIEVLLEQLVEGEWPSN